MKESSTRVIVVGAGIGGLAAATALACQGSRVDVFERVGRLEPVGAGLSLWRNALAALDAIGLGDAVREAGVPGPAAVLRSAGGAVISDFGRGRTSSDDRGTSVAAGGGRRAGVAADRGGAPGADALRDGVADALSVVLHRADLQRTLVEAAERAGARIHLGRRCTGFVDDGTKVVARFERSDGGDGTAGESDAGNSDAGNGEAGNVDAVEGDVLVGADGLHSVVRQALHGDQPPRYAGYTAWRGVVRFDHARLAVGESWGKGLRFGQLPMRGDQVYWFAVANAPAGAAAAGGEKAEVLRRFGGWHAPIRDLVEATDERAILRNDIFDRDPLTTWGQGRVTLLGDAAHPMTPNLGQGACQALEDAVVLARCLSEAGDVPTALRNYERERGPRTRSIVLRSRQMGAVGQWRNPLAVTLRDAIFRALPASVQQRELAPILDWRP